MLVGALYCTLSSSKNRAVLFLQTAVLALATILQSAAAKRLLLNILYSHRNDQNHSWNLSNLKSPLIRNHIPEKFENEVEEMKACSSF